LEDKHFLLSGMFSAILLSSAFPALAGNVPADCVSMGGSVNESGACVFGEDTQLGETGLQEDIILTDGEMLIIGNKTTGRKPGIQIGANNGRTVTLQNNGTGALTIQGGDKVYSYGIDTAATGAGSKFWIRNSSSGDLNIFGSATTRTVDGILNGAVDGATFVIDNEADGNLLIQGGTHGKTSYGIYHGATGEGSVFEINNKGDGNLTISGGNYESSMGIYELSANGGKGRITNSGNGTLTFKAGEALKSYAIYLLNQGDVIENSGSGKILLDATQGRYLFGASTHDYSRLERIEFINSGSGDIEFRTEDTFLFDWANNGNGVGGDQIKVSNLRDGQIIFNVGTNPYADIDNTGTGKIIFGERNKAGLYGNIVNSEQAEIVVEANGVGGGYVENSGLITIKPFGTFKSRGINNKGIVRVEDNALLHGDGNGFTNSGSLYIAPKGKTKDLEHQFSNEATGQIFMPTEIMFTKESLTFADIPFIQGLGYSSGTEGIYSAPTYEDYKWTLKDRWKNNAKFKDGGSITFLDTWENTLNAADIEKLFTQVWGNGTSLIFQTGSEPEVGEFLITTDTVNEVLKDWRSTNSVLYTTDFVSNQKDLIIGYEKSITGSTGFKTLSNADSLTIKKSHTFHLLGDGIKATDASINIEDASELLLGTTSEKITSTQGGSLGPIQQINGRGKVLVFSGPFRTSSLSVSHLMVGQEGIFTVDDLQGTQESAAIYNNGLLDIGSLNLSDSWNLVNESTGTLKLSYNDIFTEGGAGSATLNTIGIAEKKETMVKPVTTSYFAEGKLGGKLLDSIKTHVQWRDGGNLIVKIGDQEVSQAVWNGAVKDFKNTYGTAGTTISYEGTLANKGTGALAGGVFNIAALNILYANEPSLRGVIYVDRSLDGEGSDIHVGSSANSLQNSTGFMSVINAPKVLVDRADA